MTQKPDRLSQAETTLYLMGRLHSLGVSYQQVADTIGVTWMTAHRWGRGESTPRPAGPINKILSQMLGEILSEREANSPEKIAVLA